MTDRRTRTLFVVGLVVTIAVAVGLSQVASGEPDGLEYVAEQEGFLDTARDSAVADGPLADYGADLTGNDVLDTAVAGVVGVAVTFGIGWGLFWLLRRRRART